MIEEALGKRAEIEAMGSQQGDVSITYADIFKPGLMLDYHPKVNMEKGIKRLVKLVKWYQGKKEF